MLNWQESISAVSSFSVDELRGAEVTFTNSLTGMAVVDNFLESPRYDRSHINTEEHPLWEEGW